MPVTLEPVGTFGFSPAFWNLPAVTANGEPIEYFTFSSRWDLRLLTHWELVALHPVGNPATGQVMRLMQMVEEDELPVTDGTGETATPAYPDESNNFIGVSPAELDAFIAWLQECAAHAEVEGDIRHIFEPVTIDDLVRLGLPRNSLYDVSMSIGGQPHRYYLYRRPDQDERDAESFTVFKVSGWTSLQYPGSAGKSLRFDTYTAERLALIHEVQAHYGHGKKPLTEQTFSLFGGDGLGPTRVTPAALGALARLLERHRFPQSDS